MDKRRHIVYLSLGSNLGDRLGFINRSIKSLEKRIGENIRMSSVYETKPWGNDGLYQFLNLVACFETLLSPLELLVECQKIEKEMGRVEKLGIQYENRCIDIDLLFFDKIQLNHPDLTLPHPLLKSRLFVLIPLAEILNQIESERLMLNIDDLIDNCEDDSGIQKMTSA